MQEMRWIQRRVRKLAPFLFFVLFCSGTYLFPHFCSLAKKKMRDTPLWIDSLTMASIQRVDFSSVIITQAQSLTNWSLSICRYNGWDIQVLGERKPTVMHHTVVVIWFAKARSQISWVFLEVSRMLCKWNIKKNALISNNLKQILSSYWVCHSRHLTSTSQRTNQTQSWHWLVSSLTTF